MSFIGFGVVGQVGGEEIPEGGEAGAGLIVDEETLPNGELTGGKGGLGVSLAGANGSEPVTADFTSDSVTSGVLSSSLGASGRGGRGGGTGEAGFKVSVIISVIGGSGGFDTLPNVGRGESDGV